MTDETLASGLSRLSMSLPSNLYRQLDVMVQGPATRNRLLLGRDLCA